MEHTHASHTSVFCNPGEGTGASVGGTWLYTQEEGTSKHCTVHRFLQKPGPARPRDTLEPSTPASCQGNTDSGWLPTAPGPSEALSTPAAIDSGQCLWCSEMDSPSGAACWDLMSRHQTQERCGEGWGLEEHKPFPWVCQGWLNHYNGDLQPPPAVPPQHTRWGSSQAWGQRLKFWDRAEADPTLSSESAVTDGLKSGHLVVETSCRPPTLSDPYSQEMG